MKINILGSEYEIIKKKYNEDEAFARRSIDGYCDSYSKKIVYCDMTTYRNWEHENVETAHNAEKLTLRHEITHAFLYESGLNDSSIICGEAWVNNEEMIDWIAIQGAKLGL